MEDKATPQEHYRIVRAGEAVRFQNESGEAVDVLVVLSSLLAKPTRLLVDGFAVQLDRATLERL